MSWIPPNLSETCAVYTTVTTCSTSTMMFLQLVVELFGRSRDAPDYYNNNNYHTSFSSSPDFGFSTDQFSDFINHNTFSGGHHEYSSGDVVEQEYDFVVVGAGSAGCAVAGRLSEVPEWNVLLIEAGIEEPDVADVPAFPPLLMHSNIDWGFMTQPQPNSCLARDQQRCSWARGRVMGGSSSINYMIYIRGNPRDYDEWESFGNPGWSYRDVLPYFLKSEDNRNLDKVDPYYHSSGGPLTVQYFSYQDQNIFAVIDAFKELGLEEMDQNSGPQIGVSLLQHTTRNGERLSSNGAFIRPVRNKRKNLVVHSSSFATRLLIDSKTKTAYGVEYVREGKLVRAIARKEVIVSSGVFGSPKLLMLSGIGPSEHLQELRIQVIKDLRVGFNLHDHTTIDGIVFALTNLTATNVNDEQMRQDVYYYKETHKGPLSSTGPLQINAFVQTKYEADPERPDIQYSIDATNVENFFTDPILTASTNVVPLCYYNGLTVRPILLNPRSRGVVQLNRTDPIFGDPLIFANTFVNPVDLNIIVEAIKQSLNLLNTKSLQNLGYRLVSIPLPACRSYQFGTDDYWTCVATSYTSTLYHPVGTCKMGPRHDQNAVVDSRLRVHGINNLRVIDSSIMPRVVRGNTNAPSIMIGEMGSDFIKARWLKQSNAQSDYNSFHNAFLVKK